MYKSHFGPLITAVVTPFDEHFQVDVKQFEKLMGHLIDTGSTALVITGTTGAGEYGQVMTAQISKNCIFCAYAL